MSRVLTHRKNVSFQLLDQQQEMIPSGLSFHSPQKYNSEPGQLFHGKPKWQTRPHHQPINQQNSRPSFPQVILGSRQIILLGLQYWYAIILNAEVTHRICFQYQRQMLEGAQPPMCYFCRQIGHLVYQCPKRLQTGYKHTNIPGPPPNQGNHWVSTVSPGQWINRALRKPKQLPD